MSCGRRRLRDQLAVDTHGWLIPTCHGHALALGFDLTSQVGSSGSATCFAARREGAREIAAARQDATIDTALIEEQLGQSGAPGRIGVERTRQRG